jgi:hypothetical protein
MKAFEKELAVVKARVDGLEAAVGELEATQFSTTTKLKGKVRFIAGDVYRGDGLQRFGKLKDVIKMAKYYGYRFYDGSTGGLQDRTVNRIKDGKPNGTAYYYYRWGTGYGADGAKAGVSPSSVSTSSEQSPAVSAQAARQLAFSTTWTGIAPSSENKKTSGLDNGAGLHNYNANTGAVEESTTAANGAGYTLIVPTLNGTPGSVTGVNGLVTPLFTPGKSRGAIYMKDGILSNSTFNLPSAAGQAANDNIVVAELAGLKNGVAADSFLRARNFYTTNAYGGTRNFRVQSSYSTSSNYKSYKVQFDKADYGALLNLANKSRRVKAYEYFNFTNASRGTGATQNSTAGLAKVTKAAGIPDPVKISDIARGYVATTSTPGVTTAGFTQGSALLTGVGGGKFVVAPGGFAQNNATYSDVADYLIAEYGSLSEQQRKVGYVKNAAQLFVRSLAAYPANKNGVADRNAFTFSHDAQLNFNTSFTGKDLLNFRLRSNTVYSFAKRAGAPFADLAIDGSLPEEWTGKDEIFIDKLYYKFPVGSWGKVSVGTRAPQSSFTTRGSMYTKDALLEFFNTAGGVYPSVTGAAFGVQVNKIGGKKLKVFNGSVAGSIGYITNEGDAASPDSYNYLQQGFFGRDTRFRLPVQLAWKSKGKKWLFTANYAYERGMNSMGKVGTELARNPFGYSNLIESNQYGFTLAYKWNKQFQVTGSWGANSMSSRYDSSVLGIDMTSAGDSAQTNSWMIALNFKDVFIEGNKAGFAIGGVPTVTSNDSGWGTDSSQPIALETWYQFQVTDNISVTPGVFWVSGQDEAKTGKYGQVSVDGGSSDVWGGIVKTEFKF